MSEDEENNSVEEVGTALKKITDEMIDYMIKINDHTGLSILGGLLAKFCQIQMDIRQHQMEFPGDSETPQVRNEADQDSLNKLKEKYQNGDL